DAPREANCAVEIDLHAIAPILIATLNVTADPRIASIVDQDVNSTQTLDGLIDYTLYIVVTSRITRSSDYFHAMNAQLSASLLQISFPSCANGNVRTFLGEFLSNRLAESFASAGHQRHLFPET